MLVSVPDQGDLGFSRGRDRRTPPPDEPGDRPCGTRDRGVGIEDRPTASIPSANPLTGVGYGCTTNR